MLILSFQCFVILFDKLEIYRVIRVIDKLVIDSDPFCTPGGINFGRRFFSLSHLLILWLWFCLNQFTIYTQSKDSGFVWVSRAVPGEPDFTTLIANRITGLII